MLQMRMKGGFVSAKGGKERDKRKETSEREKERKTKIGQLKQSSRKLKGNTQPPFSSLLTSMF